MYCTLTCIQEKKIGKTNTMSYNGRRLDESKRQETIRKIVKFRRFIATIFDLSTFPVGTRFYLLKNDQLRIDLPNVYTVKEKGEGKNMNYSFIYGLNEEKLLNNKFLNESLYLKGNVDSTLDPNGEKSMVPYINVVAHNVNLEVKKYNKTDERHNKIGEQKLDKYGKLKISYEFNYKFRDRKECPFVVYDFEFRLEQSYIVTGASGQKVSIPPVHDVTLHKKLYMYLDDDQVNGGLLILEIKDDSLQKAYPWIIKNLVTYKDVIDNIFVNNKAHTVSWKNIEQHIHGEEIEDDYNVNLTPTDNFTKDESTTTFKYTHTTVEDFCNEPGKSKDYFIGEYLKGPKERGEAMRDLVVVEPPPAQIQPVPAKAVVDPASDVKKATELLERKVRIAKENERKKEERKKEERARQEEENQLKDIFGEPHSTTTNVRRRKSVREVADIEKESVYDAHQRTKNFAENMRRQDGKPRLQVINLGADENTTTVQSLPPAVSNPVYNPQTSAATITLNTTYQNNTPYNNTMSCNTNYVGNTQSVGTNNVVQDGMIIWYPQPRNSTAEMVNQHNDRSAAYLNQMNQNYYNPGYGNQGYNNQGYGNQYYGNQDYYNQSYYNQGYTQYQFPPFGGQ